MPTFEEKILARGDIELHRPKAAPDVAPANSARVYYDADQGALQVSNDGGAYSGFADLTAAGVTATATEINKLHGVIAGTVSASKVLVADASKDVAGARFFNTSGGTLGATGANQGAAAAIVTENVSVTGSDDAKGVKLPTAVAGMMIRLANTVSAKNLLVYPATGATIDFGLANAAITLAGQKSALFFATSATQWYSVVTA